MKRKLQEKADFPTKVWLAVEASTMETKILYSTTDRPKGKDIVATKTVTLQSPLDFIVVYVDDDYNFGAMGLNQSLIELEKAWEGRAETPSRQIIETKVPGAEFDSDWFDEPERFETFDDYKKWWEDALIDCPFGTDASGAIFSPKTGKIKVGTLTVEKA